MQRDPRAWLWDVRDAASIGHSWPVASQTGTLMFARAWIR